MALSEGEVQANYLGSGAYGSCLGMPTALP